MRHVAVVAQPGRGHDRHRREALVAAELVDEPVPVDPRHAQVAEDDVRQMSLRLQERLVSVACLADSRARRAQEHAHQLERVGIVVDDQYRDALQARGNHGRGSHPGRERVPGCEQIFLSPAGTRRASLLGGCGAWPMHQPGGNSNARAQQAEARAEDRAAQPPADAGRRINAVVGKAAITAALTLGAARHGTPDTHAPEEHERDRPGRDPSRAARLPGAPSGSGPTPLVQARPRGARTVHATPISTNTSTPPRRSTGSAPTSYAPSSRWSPASTIGRSRTGAPRA